MSDIAKCPAKSPHHDVPPRECPSSSDVPWPKISIVTPSLNQGRYLETAIRSVLVQRYPNLEYIVMDGGSTDDTMDVLRRYDDCIAHWVSEKDNGQTDAINKGFSLATGDVVAWLNADDVYLPNVLRLIGTLFGLHPDFDWVVGSTVHMDSGLERFEGVHYPKCRPDSWAGFVCNKQSGISLPQPSSFWSMRLVRQVGALDTDLHYSFDHDFYCAAAYSGFRPWCMNIPLAAFRVHPESKTSSGLLPFRREELAVVDKYLKRSFGEERHRLLKYRRFLLIRIVKLRLAALGRRYFGLEPFRPTVG